MKKIIIIIFVLTFGKIQAQADWSVVPIWNFEGYFGYSLNVIDSLTVILTPKYISPVPYGNPSIIKTSDGGQTWTHHLIDPTIQALMFESEFIDENIGYFVGGAYYGSWKVLLKTSNGGETWQSIDTSFLLTGTKLIGEVSFVSSEIGFIARPYGDNKIYRTTDGGMTFTALDLPQTPSGFATYISELRFINPDVGFVIKILHNNYNNGIAEILKTTDGGITWNIVSTANIQDVNIWLEKDKIQFVNDLQGFAIVGEGILKVTQDGGNSWTEYNLPLPTPRPTDIHFINNTCGYLALAGNIYRTDDAGQSWSLQTIDNDINKVTQIRFATENFGYALNFELNHPQSSNVTTILKTNEQLASVLLEDNYSFSVYPNPANDVIYIHNTSNTEKIDFIHLLDTTGKIIKTYKNNFTQLDISSFSSGNYLLFIQTPLQKITKKVIIK